MKGLIVAIQFLTRLPTPRLSVSREEFAASIRWFPAVGLIIGALLMGVIWLARPLGDGMAAMAALLLWVAVTGALHLDGLGDIADASGAAHQDKERLLAVLADPHIGSFGVVAIGVQLLMKFTLLHALIAAKAEILLLFIPFLARMGPLYWALRLPSLHSGLGDMFRPAVTPLLLMLWAALAVPALTLHPALIAAPIFFWLWGIWVVRKIGGISGDGHGAGIEWGESLLILAGLIGALLL